ncbi:hypothetical protein Enr10x_46990 [Gimesia panareensis]|uniref:DUF1559 domain-containing protein n=2 Tax=Gimesia panareensis TaxID=2527978 RepID=A0A517QCJ3_9PLAN|nr:hypothetical protein Enr10x_46990 [Gimesia panareensis]
MNPAQPSDSDRKTLPVSIQALIVFIIVGAMIALLYPAVKQSREMTRSNANHRGNLRMLGMALATYSDISNQHLPMGGNTDQLNQPLHGWMTSLLPYINESAMAREIDDSRAWNAPENKKVFSIVIPLFLNSHFPEGPKQNAAGYGLSHFSANSQLFPVDQSISTETIQSADGLSNTIMAGEISSSFPAWGSATNVRDPAKGLNGCPDCFGSPDRKGAFLLFADGHVRFIDQNIDPQVLKALSTPAGGEPIP